MDAGPKFLIRKRLLAPITILAIALVTSAGPPQSCGQENNPFDHGRCQNFRGSTIEFFAG